VELDGSSTVYPISEAAASAFGEKYPNVKATVGVSGTGGGFKRFVRGEIDVSNASRPIKWEEHLQCAEVSPPVQYLELPVAYDGLTVVVNPANDWVDQITVEQLQEIYLEGGAAQTWKDLNPDWPDGKIQVYSPGTDSGTFDFFREVMIGSGEGRSMRKDMSTNEDDNVLVTGVAGDKNSIGFFGASYYFNNKEKLKAVPVVNPSSGQAVLPSPEAVESGEYAPLSRPLFIYVNVNSLKRPEMQRFVEFYLDRAAEFAVQVDYVGLSEDVSERAKEHFRKKTIGTHFWTPEGEKREGGLLEVFTTENAVPVQG
jgi:phosphate transport system substrate-binding protein